MYLETATVQGFLEPEDVTPEHLVIHQGSHREAVALVGCREDAKIENRWGLPDDALILIAVGRTEWVRSIHRTQSYYNRVEGRQ